MIRRRFAQHVTPPRRVAPPTNPELEDLLDDLDEEDLDDTLDPDEPPAEPPRPEELNDRILDHR
jgi:hypothetical protein